MKNKKAGLIGVIILIIILVVLAGIVFTLYSLDKTCFLECVKWSNKIINP